MLRVNLQVNSQLSRRQRDAEDHRVARLNPASKEEQQRNTVARRLAREDPEIQFSNLFY